MISNPVVATLVRPAGWVLKCWAGSKRTSGLPGLAGEVEGEAEDEPVGVGVRHDDFVWVERPDLVAVEFEKPVVPA